jgi:hypothetical protein
MTELIIRIIGLIIELGFYYTFYRIGKTVGYRKGKKERSQTINGSNNTQIKK